MRRLVDTEIDVSALLAAVGGDGDGAQALFLGRVRDRNAGRVVRWLEYEAYGPMAEREIGRLEQVAMERFEIDAARIVHRTGRLEIGDVSVAVVTAAAHRAAAFDACRWLIDTLKQTVPIWKKEHFEGGHCWIEGPGEPPPPQA